MLFDLWQTGDRFKGFSINQTDKEFEKDKKRERWLNKTKQQQKEKQYEKRLAGNHYERFEDKRMKTKKEKAAHYQLKYFF